MKYNIENITREDIKITSKYNATYEELMSAFDLAEIMENEIIQCNEPMWRKMCMVLYAYKLGVMHGKREERRRERKATEQVKISEKDKVKEIEDINKVLNNPDVKVEDIRKIKYLILGCLNSLNKKNKGLERI